MNDTQRTFLLETLPRLGGLALLAGSLTAAAHCAGLAAGPGGPASAALVSLFLASLVFFREAALPAALGCALLLLGKNGFDEGNPGLMRPCLFLFLMGLMVVTAAMKDFGVMTCLVQFVINRRGLNGVSFCLLLSALSVFSAALFGSWFSVFVMCALVFQICDALKLKPAPFVVMSVVATNFGACMSLSGSPLALFLGANGGEASYAAFLIRAAPAALALTAASELALMAVFHRDVRLLGRRLREQRERNRGLGPRMHLSCRRGLALFVSFQLLLLLHVPLSVLFGRCTGIALSPHAMLMLVPPLFAVVLLFARPKRAEACLRESVDWKLLLTMAGLSVISGALRDAGTFPSSFSLASGKGAFLAGLLATPFTGDLAAGTLLSGFLPEGGTGGCPYALLFGCAAGANLFAAASLPSLAAVRLLDEHTHRRTGWKSWTKAGAASTAVSALVYLLFFA